MTAIRTLMVTLAAFGALLAVPMSRAEDASPQTFWGTETAEAATLEKLYASKAGTMGIASHAMVAACHDRSVEIGLDILRRGGSAADAFIAASFADYVQSPGASSLGGPMAALVYEAQTGEVQSLGAPLKAVQSLDGQWTVGEEALGKQVMVPGAVAGLEALYRRHGRLPWPELVLPAARLARKGFPVTPLFATITNAYAAALTSSTYGRAAYLRPDASSYVVGSIIKLPVLAGTLEAIARDGASYVQTGEWAQAAVVAVRERGGEMTLADLADYRPEWSKPLSITYRGRTIYGLGGHDSGGARLLLALKVL